MFEVLSLMLVDLETVRRLTVHSGASTEQVSLRCYLPGDL